MRVKLVSDQTAISSLKAGRVDSESIYAVRSEPSKVNRAILTTILPHFSTDAMVPLILQYVLH